jgi:esterase/lipase superfamily enzyme
VDAVNVLDEGLVRQMLRRALAGREEDVLLMVHGFNNTAEFAMLRLAQLKIDLHFPGKALLFCWPSQGSASAYLDDEVAAAASVPALKEVLETLIAEYRAAGNADRRVHLLAHSMGNRILLNALAEIAVGGLPSGSTPFGQVILAAPDVDFVMMNRVFKQAARCAEGITLYYCEDDVALQASRELNRDSRIGQRGVFEDGLENVDAKHANTSFLGHDYFSASNRLLVDLELLINLRLNAAGRTQTVKSRQDNIGNLEWYFPQPPQ